MVMTKEEMINVIKKEFKIDSLLAPWGLCTDDFINKKIIEIAEENKFPQNIIAMFKHNPIYTPPLKECTYGFGFTSAKTSGEYFIDLIKKYEERKVAEDGNDKL